MNETVLSYVRNAIRRRSTVTVIPGLKKPQFPGCTTTRCPNLFSSSFQRLTSSSLSSSHYASSTTDPKMAQTEMVMITTQAAASSGKAKLRDMEAQDDEDSEVDEETKRWRDMERTIWTRVAQGIAGASIVLNLLAMILEASGSVVVMALIALAVGSVVIYFQFALQDTDCKCTNERKRERESERC